MYQWFEVTVYGKVVCIWEAHKNCIVLTVLILCLKNKYYPWSKVGWHEIYLLFLIFLDFVLFKFMLGNF